MKTLFHIRTRENKPLTNNFNEELVFDTLIKAYRYWNFLNHFRSEYDKVCIWEENTETYEFIPYTSKMLL